MSTTVVAEDAGAQIFVNARGATESNSDAKVLPVISTVVNRFIAKALQTSSPHTSVDRSVQKYLAMPHAIFNIVKSTINAPALTLFFAKQLEQHVEKRFILKAEMKLQFNFSNETVIHDISAVEDEFKLNKLNLGRSAILTRGKSGI